MKLAFVLHALPTCGVVWCHRATVCGVGLLSPHPNYNCVAACVCLCNTFWATFTSRLRVLPVDWWGCVISFWDQCRKFRQYCLNINTMYDARDLETVSLFVTRQSRAQLLPSTFHYVQKLAHWKSHDASHLHYILFQLPHLSREITH